MKRFIKNLLLSIITIFIIIIGMKINFASITDEIVTARYLSNGEIEVSNGANNVLSIDANKEANNEIGIASRVGEIIFKDDGVYVNDKNLGWDEDKYRLAWAIFNATPELKETNNEKFQLISNVIYKSISSLGDQLGISFEGKNNDLIDTSIIDEEVEEFISQCKKIDDDKDILKVYPSGKSTAIKVQEYNYKNEECVKIGPLEIDMPYGGILDNYEVIDTNNSVISENECKIIKANSDEITANEIKSQSPFYVLVKKSAIKEGIKSIKFNATRIQKHIKEGSKISVYKSVKAGHPDFISIEYNGRLEEQAVPVTYNQNVDWKLTEEAKPSDEETKPAEEETKPAEEETKPSEEEPKPAEEEPKLAEPPKPAEEETKPYVGAEIQIHKYAAKPDGTADTEKGVLEGARFIVKNLSTNEYVKHINGKYQPTEAIFNLDNTCYEYVTELREENMLNERGSNFAQFYLTNVAGKPIILKNLKPGKYKITELLPPDGYSLSANGDNKSNSHTITINGDGTIKEPTNQLHFINKEAVGANLEINKFALKTDGSVDEGKGVLGGAGFIIKNITTNQYLTHTGTDYTTEKTELNVKESSYKTLTSSDENLLVNIDPSKFEGYTFMTTEGQPIKLNNLKPGKYEITEIIAPKGYSLSVNGNGNSNKHTITVSEEGKILENTDRLNFHNSESKDVEVKIYKYAAKSDGTADTEKGILEGARFVIKNTTTNQYLKHENGEYQPTQGVFNPNNSNYEILLENNEQKMLNEKGEEFGRFYFTNARDVVIKLRNLKPGKYKITEIIPPDGYSLSTNGDNNSNSQTITINYDGSIIEATDQLHFINRESIGGNIEIHKYALAEDGSKDEDNGILEGASFAVKNKTTNQYVTHDNTQEKTSPIVTMAKKVHKILEDKKYKYGSNTSLTIEESENQGKKECNCSTYLDWVLNELGLDLKTRLAGAGMKSELDAADWCEPVASRDVAQPGDIVLYNGHVQIYGGKSINGQDQWYNAGSEESIKTRAPSVIGLPFGSEIGIYRVKDTAIPEELRVSEEIKESSYKTLSKEDEDKLLNIDPESFSEYLFTTTAGQPIRLNQLKPGEYEVTELIAPEGYSISTDGLDGSNTLTITINEDGSIAEETNQVRFYNKIAEQITPAEMQISKYAANVDGTADKQSGILDGAIFVVKNTSTGMYIKHVDDNYQTEEGIFETNETNYEALSEEDEQRMLNLREDEFKQYYLTNLPGKPIIINNLISGKYTITELLPPDGYSLSTNGENNSNSRTLTVRKDGTIVQPSNELEFINKEAVGGNIEIHKNAQNEDGSEDTEKGIMGGAGFVIKNTTTNQYVTHTEESYEEEETTLEAKEYLYKILDETSEKELLLNNSSGYENYLFTTTEGQPIRLNNLKPGKYEVTEIIAPEGYNLAKNGEGNTNKLTITINEDGSIEEEDNQLHFYDSECRDKEIHIYKYGLTENGDIDKEKGILKGARFVVKNVTTDEYLTHSDENYNESEGTFDVEDSSYKKLSEDEERNVLTGREENKKDYYLTSTNEKPIVLKNLKAGEYKITEVLPPEGYSLSANGEENPNSQTLTVNEDGTIKEQTNEMFFYNKKQFCANIEINKFGLNEQGKIDKNSEVIEGASFTIKNVTTNQYVTHTNKNYPLQNNEINLNELSYNTLDEKNEELLQKRESSLVKNYTFNTLKGKSIKLNNLKPGEYEVRELVAPEGYNFSTDINGNSTNVQTLVINEDGSTEDDKKSLDFYNSKYKTADIEIHKYAANPDGTTNTEKGILEGARFVVKNTTTNEYLKHVNGEYQPTEGIFNAKTSSYTVLNETSEQLMFNERGQAYGEYYFTNVAGKAIQLKNLKPGVYKITEILPPDGYSLSTNGDGNTNTHTITINGDGTIKEPTNQLHFINKEAVGADIKIVKFALNDDGTVNENKGMLGGASFVIKNTTTNQYVTHTRADYTSEKTELDVNEIAYKTLTENDEDNLLNTNPSSFGEYTFKTTEGQPIKLNKLKPGDYEVTEVIAPNGYYLSENERTHKFTIYEDGTISLPTNELHFHNREVKGGEIEIHKYALKEDGNVDEEKGILEGARFVVKNTTTNEYIKHTDENYQPTEAVFNVDNSCYVPASQYDENILLKEKPDTYGELLLTNIAGKPIQLRNLKPGKYDVTEVMPPEGYRLSANGNGESNTHSITVNDNGQVEGSTNQLHFHNYPADGEGIEIRKYALKEDGSVDEEKGILEGARFVVKNVTTNEYIKHTDANYQPTEAVFNVDDSCYVPASQYNEDTIINQPETYGELLLTNVAGKAIQLKSLKPGKYEVREVIPPEGYKLSENGEGSSTVHTKVVFSNGTVSGESNQLHFHNREEKNGEIEIHKYALKEDGSVDEEKGILEGARFVVKNTTTNEYIKHTDENYQPTEAVFNVDNSCYVPASQYDENILLKEKPDTYGELLLTNVAGKPIQLKNLKPGKYDVTEVMPPEGYRLSANGNGESNTHSITINDNGQVEESTNQLHFHNYPADGEGIEIRKYELYQNGNVNLEKGILEGARFVVKNVTTNEYIKHTDANYQPTEAVFNVDDSCYVPASQYNEDTIINQPETYGELLLTNVAGKAIQLKNLKAGKYEIREVIPPDGYELSENGEKGSTGLSYNGNFIWPVQGQDTPEDRAGNITAIVGERTSPGGVGSTNHGGMDIACATGTPILATADGTVTVAGESGGYGNLVEIDHGTVDGKKMISRYGHNSEVKVTVGQQVKQGDVIALAGSTGNSTGSHCHFEIRMDDEVYDPLNLYSADYVKGNTAGAQTDYVEGSKNGEIGSTVHTKVVFSNGTVSGESNQLHFHNLKKISTDLSIELSKNQESIDIGYETQEESSGSPTNVLLPGAEFIAWYTPANGPVAQKYYKEQLGLDFNKVENIYKNTLVSIDEKGNAVYNSNLRVNDWDKNENEASQTSFIPEFTEYSLNNNEGYKETGKTYDIDNKIVSTIKVDETTGKVKMNNLLPGIYHVKEVKAPDRPESGFNLENGQKIDIIKESNGKQKDNETYNDFVIDESRPVSLEVNFKDENVENATEKLGPIAFDDETAAGMHVKIYEYNKDNPESIETPLKGEKVTIQLKADSIVRPDEKEVSGIYEGRYLDPKGLEGDYKSDDGAKVITHNKADAYKEAESDKDAVSKNLVFETNDKGEIYIRNLIPGTYIIKQLDTNLEDVNNGLVKRAEILSKNAWVGDENNGELKDKKVVYKEQGENAQQGEENIDKVIENGIEVYTRKKEFSHPVLSIWKAETTKVSIRREDTEGNILNGSEVSIEYLEDGTFLQKTGIITDKDYGTEEVPLTITENTVFENLKPGKYRIRERKAPDGTSLSDKYYDFEVLEDGTIVYNDSENNNDLGNNDSSNQKDASIVIKTEPLNTQELQVSKVYGNSKIQGSSFTLKYTKADSGYKQYEGKYVQSIRGNNIAIDERYKENEEKEFVTGKDGENGKDYVSFLELLPGTYTVEEKTSPAGYKLTTQTPEELSASIGRIDNVKNAREIKIIGEPLGEDTDNDKHGVYKYLVPSNWEVPSTNTNTNTSTDPNTNTSTNTPENPNLPEDKKPVPDVEVKVDQPDATPDDPIPEYPPDIPRSPIPLKEYEQPRDVPNDYWKWEQLPPTSDVCNVAREVWYGQAWGQCSPFVIEVLRKLGVWQEGYGGYADSVVNFITTAGKDLFMEVPPEATQAGDIIWWSGHTQICAGVNQWFNSGSDLVSWPAIQNWELSQVINYGNAREGYHAYRYVGNGSASSSTSGGWRAVDEFGNQVPDDLLNQWGGGEQGVNNHNTDVDRRVQEANEYNAWVAEENKRIKEYNDWAEDQNKKLERAKRCHNAREELIQANTDNGIVITDVNGYADLGFLSELKPDASGEEYSSQDDGQDDGMGLITVEEESVGSNPYINVGDYNKRTFRGTLTEDIIFVNPRMRVDIEGYIFEDIPNGQKEGTQRRTVDAIFNGQDKLMYPIAVKLKNGDTVIGEGIITTDGRYKIRAGGANGEYMKYIEDDNLVKDTYIEFTYNGLKYQSCYDAVLEQENGSKAEEKAEDRKAFNERLSTISSNNGEATTDHTADGQTEINHEETEAYEKGILYEGEVSGKFSGEGADPIADGKYTLGNQMLKADEIDPQTQQTRSNGDTDPSGDNCYYINNKTEGSKYQIQADTKTAGYKGFEEYDYKQDKITGINLGLYEREQPDISLINDIERVVVEINDEQYLYQYGAKTQNIDDVFNQDPTVKFGSDINPGKYTREVQAEKIQIEPEGDPFKVKIYYKTAVRNESANLLMKPIEIVSQYDSRYQSVRDATDEIKGDTNAVKGINNFASTADWSDKSTCRGDRSAPEGYKNAFRTINEIINPGEEVVFFTEYTIGREQAIGLIEGEETLEFYNNVEVNAYQTSYPEQERREEIGTNLYAGVDVDSVAGNSDPTNKQMTFEDDNDEAPIFELKLTDPRILKGNVFEDLAQEVGTGEERDVEELMAYLGNGLKDSEEKGIKNVRVELVELDDDGNLMLDNNGETRAKLDVDWKSNEDPVKASVITDESGNYEFKGFIPGEYVVRFTWGQGQNTVMPSTNETAYVQQYKSTIFSDEERYKTMTTSTEKPTTNRWYLDSSNLVKNPSSKDEQPFSSAIDDMIERKEIDNRVQNTGFDKSYGNILTYPELETDTTVQQEVHSFTPAFDVGIEKVEQNSEDTSKKTKGKNGYDQFIIENLDFGISKRPKMDMTLEKRIERVKLTAANGNTLVDASVDWENGKLKGSIQDTTYPMPSKDDIANNDIGKLKIEMDQEIMQDASLEISYQFVIRNLSQLDYVITDESGEDSSTTTENNVRLFNAYDVQNNVEKNQYFKYGDFEKANQLGEEEVKIAPTVIIDYLDNKMNYLNKPFEDSANAPEENDLWERIPPTDIEKQKDELNKYLYDGSLDKTKLYQNKKYNDYTKNGNEKSTNNIQSQLEYINKHYWTILRNTTEKMSNVAEKDKVYLKAQEEDAKTIKFIASKHISDTNEGLLFYNSAEILQMNRTGGAIPEDSLTGNHDPTSTGYYDEEDPSPNYSAEHSEGSSEQKSEFVVEKDGEWASAVTITPPTGDSRNYYQIVITLTSLAALSILAIVLAVKRKTIIKKAKAKNTKKDADSDKK